MKRFLLALIAIIGLATPLLVEASVDPHDRDWYWDNDWLRQTNGGFIDEYPFDPSIFYYTLPSRAENFALHPYFRNRYYQYFHGLPPPRSYKAPLTSRELHDCGSYSFRRPNGVPPYGYACKNEKS